MNLVLDIGNSYAKLAAFDGAMQDQCHILPNRTLDGIEDICKSYAFEKGIFSTVIDLDEEVRQKIYGLGIPMMELTHETPMPITLEYKTPGTLGTDRIAAVAGARALFPHRDVMVVDSGTAITYDLITKEGVYKGGNITPGLKMRLQALHDYTDRLPQVDINFEAQERPGTNTQEAIAYGVRMGVDAEFRAHLEAYKKICPDLTVLVTKMLGDKAPEGVSFTIENNLVLEGLNSILRYNDK